MLNDSTLIGQKPQENLLSLTAPSGKTPSLSKAAETPSSANRRMPDTVAKTLNNYFGEYASGIVWGLAYQKDRFNNNSSARNLIIHTRAICPPAFFADFTSSNRETRREANQKHIPLTQQARLKHATTVNFLLAKIAAKDERSAGEIVAVKRLLVRLGMDCTSEQSIKSSLRRLLLASHPDRLVLSEASYDADIQKRQSRCYFDMTQLLKNILLKQGDVHRVLLVPGGQRLDGRLHLLLRSFVMVFLKIYCGVYCEIFKPDLSVEQIPQSIFCPLQPNVSPFASSHWCKKLMAKGGDVLLRDYQSAIIKENRPIKTETWADGYTLYPKRFEDSLGEPCLVQAFHTRDL